MTRTVWKYELHHVTTLDLPRDSTVLHVAPQIQGDGHSLVCLWAEVDPDKPTIQRRFYVVGTGHPIPADALPPTHIGTFLSDQRGTFVFHVYESLDARIEAAATMSDG